METASLHSDEELVIRARTDSQFFEPLVDRYEARLRAYLRRLGVATSEDVQDLMQEVFIKAYQNLNAFDTSLAFSSWIYRIAHNEAMSHFRRLRSRPQGHAIDVEDAVMDTIAADTDVLSESAKSHDAERLKQMLGRLPTDYYEVLILHFFEHKSYEEISDILSLPGGTVATRLRRAKVRLKELMKSNGYSHE